MLRGRCQAWKNTASLRARRRLLAAVPGCLMAVAVLATSCGATPSEEPSGVEDPAPSLASPEDDLEAQSDRAADTGNDPGEAETDDAAVEVEDDPGEAETDDAAVEVEDDPGEASAQDEELAAEFPDDNFTAIATGAWHSCGLREEGRAECWGSNPFGQAEAPEEPFSALAAGERHSCGLRADGTVTCWGNNEVGQTFAPDRELHRAIRRVGALLWAASRRFNRVLGHQLGRQSRSARRPVQRSVRR